MQNANILDAINAIAINRAQNAEDSGEDLGDNIPKQKYRMYNGKVVEIGAQDKVEDTCH